MINLLDDKDNKISVLHLCTIAPIKVEDRAYKDTQLVRSTVEGLANAPVVETARTHNTEDAITITSA